MRRSWPYPPKVAGLNSTALRNGAPGSHPAAFAAVFLPMAGVVLLGAR